MEVAKAAKPFAEAVRRLKIVGARNRRVPCVDVAEWIELAAAYDAANDQEGPL